MYLIDTHAHIYINKFDDDRDRCMIAAKTKGVEKILMPAIDATTHEAMLATEQQYPFCIAMMGVHPCSVNAEYKTELEITEKYWEQRKFIAVGEIGLDFYWDKTFIKEQYEAFHYQIQQALTYDVPIVIHSRNATDECIDVIEQYPALRGVFHCFSGNDEQAMKIKNAGFMMGIGGVVTFKNSGLDKVIEKNGLDGIILETDAPYLAPVPYRGKRNEPAYVALVAEKLSELMGLTVQEIAERTTKNAKKLFKL